jgi:hypothetical protein
LKPGVVTSSNRPANPYDGMMIYETDTDRAAVWDGSSWVYKTGKTTLQIVEQTHSTQVDSTAYWTAVTYVFQASITPISSASKLYVEAIVPRQGGSGGGRLATIIRYDTTSGGTTGTELAQCQTHFETATNNYFIMPAVMKASVSLGSTSTHYFKVVITHYDRASTETHYACVYGTRASMYITEVL